MVFKNRRISDILQQIKPIKPHDLALRTCRICNFKVFIEEKLQLFKKSESSRFGRDNICNKCNLQYMNNRRKMGSKIRFKGRTFSLEKNPRTNICTLCGKNQTENAGKQMSIHHTNYNNDDPLANTIELCVSCHAKLHHALRRLKKQPSSTILYAEKVGMRLTYQRIHNQN